MELPELEHQHDAARRNQANAATAEDRRTYGDLAGYFARRVKQARRDLLRSEG